MSNPMAEYRALESKLRELRRSMDSRDTTLEQESVLQQMETLWWTLTEEDQELISSEPQAWADK